MRLWQLDIVGGVCLVNGQEHKMLTAIDDHSRFRVAATVLPVPSGPAVCDAFLAAITRWGAPFEVLTDNGKQFSGSSPGHYRSKFSSNGSAERTASLLD